MKVIGLVGYKRSGKDTFADYCINILNDKNYKAYKLSYANPLKSLVYDVLDVSKYMNDEYLKSTKKPFIGKLNYDSLNKFLVTHNLDKLSGSDYDLLNQVYYDYRDSLSVLYRKLLQVIGTEIIRKRDNDFWVTLLNKRMRVLSNILDFVFVTDVRFPNEFNTLVKHWNAYMVNICRPGMENDDMHVSESYVGSLSERCQHTIIANDLDVLYIQANFFVIFLLNYV